MTCTATQRRFPSAETRAAVAILAILIALLPAVAGAQGQTTMPASRPTSRPLPAGPPVPEAKVQGLGQALAAAEANASEQAKLRQLRAVYRDGVQLEQQYADAPNLHVVRTIMLNAARSLATIEVDDASSARLMDLARRIADSAAPPEARFWPQVLLTQSALRGLPLDSPEGPAVIEEFIAQFDQSSVEVTAIMLAVDLAERAGYVAVTNQLLGRLSYDHRYEPQVEAYLQNRGVNIFQGQSMALTLTRPDGTPLRLPADTLGKVVVLHFWTADESSAEEIADLHALHDKYAAGGLEIISVNLDSTPDKHQQFLNDNPMPWTHAVSQRGPEDPAIRKMKLPLLPFGWLIGRDGRVMYSGAGRARDSKGAWLKEVSKQVPIHVAARHTLVRMNEYRSGAFLPPLPAAPSSKIPAADLATLRRAVESRPVGSGTSPERVAAMKAALALGSSLEQAHGADPAVPWVRYTTLIAAQWLAVSQADDDAARQAVAIAERLRADAAAPASAQMLADYVLSRQKFAEAGAGLPANEPVLRDFISRHGSGDLAEPARLLGYMLAVENAQNAVRNELVRHFRDQFNNGHSPEMRGILRDLCGIEVDSGKILRTQLTAADGSVIDLPESVAGKVVVIHFWSKSALPEPNTETMPNKNTLAFDNMASSPDRNIVVLCINLDPDRAAAEAVAKEKLPGCLHVFSGRGWDDPLARKLDVQSLPRTFFLDGYGRVVPPAPIVIPRMTKRNFKLQPPATQPAEVP